MFHKLGWRLTLHCLALHICDAVPTFDLFILLHLIIGKLIVLHFILIRGRYYPISDWPAIFSIYGKNLDFKIEGIIEKKFYEHRPYESVDDKEPLLDYISKINGKQNSGTNGLIYCHSARVS